MNQETLSIVMPVYNEQDAIEFVIADWFGKLSSLGIDFQIHAYDDGSKDRSYAVMKELEEKYPKLIVHTKANSGHGPTILLGYRENAHKDWIFQVDSDNELRAEQFDKLWNQREKFDFLIGVRDGRHSPLARRIISLISRATVRVFYGSGVTDVNSPYRLLRSAQFRDAFLRIPDDTFAPNLLISAEACRKRMRIFEVPVQHTNRTTGEVSIRKWKLLKAAMRSFFQTGAYKFR